MKKKILITILSIVLAYSLFILEESVRLEKNHNSKPLITLKTDTNIDANNPNNIEDVYYSIGFKLSRKYTKYKKSSEDNLLYLNESAELLLFNKIRLWAWVS